MVDSINGEMNGFVSTAMKKPTNRPINMPSSLLSCEENNLLFKLIGHDRYTLASAVVQVLLSEPPHHMRWVYHNTGVVCFVKDYCRRSYFFRLYSLKTGLLWEQEFYRGFQYNVVTPLFHCFEASDSMAGFSFANSTDALQFSRVVIGKIEDKRAKLNRKKERQQLVQREDTYSDRSVQASQYSPSVTMNNVQEKKVNQTMENFYRVEPFVDRRSSSPVNNSIRGFMSLREKSIVRRRKLSKSEISNPISCTFEHREHIGIDGVRYGVSGSGESSTPSADFSEMLLIFQHRFPDLRECELSEVIDKYGGLDRLRNELNLQYSSNAVVCEKMKQRRPAPPPPPPTESPKFTAARVAPAPPQPRGRPSLPPPSPPTQTDQADIPSPPPLPLQLKPPQAESTPIKPEERSVLLNELSNPETRRRLKPVAPMESKRTPTGSRDSLLNAIRHFDRAKLKPASDDKISDSVSSSAASPVASYKSASGSSRSEDVRTISPPTKSTGGTMMDQIKQELERRRRLMVNADFNDEDEDVVWSSGNQQESEDEWTSGGDRCTQSSNSSVAAF